MSIPLIEPAINDVRQWADLGGQKQPEKVNPFTRQAKAPFDKKYPPPCDPIRLNGRQRIDLMPQLGLTSVGNGFPVAAEPKTALRR
ncbi:MAG: hypothetical protein WAK31_02020, partial [Chthoniobacterales bacterium]